MYTLSVEMHFDAAHYLRDYGGKCENLHGHRSVVVAKVKAKKLNKIDLAFDFTVLKKRLGEILGRYDHTCLNDDPPFDKINPSAENIARTIYDALKPALTDEPAASLTAIEVYESPDSWVRYSQD